jgi:phosphopantothenoylcysteine decarboxylase
MESTQRRLNLLIGVTGSVAAIKLPLLLQQLEEQSSTLSSPISFQVKVILTQHAQYFVSLDQLRRDHSTIQFHTDEDEWPISYQLNDSILHIQLCQWADIILIAPLDANTLAKLSHGLCDNLLTCVMRAWYLSRPIFLCPAMNTYMWHHPFTTQQLQQLTSIYPSCHILSPITKKLACGDTGLGAMMEVHDILSQIVNIIVNTPLSK